MNELWSAVSSWDYKWLDAAEFFARWSKDPSTKVGAVVVRNNRILSSGFNGFPTGVLDDNALLAQREEKYQRIVHAETNALIGVDVRRGTLYSTHCPCSSCAGLIINAGISRVVTFEPQPDMKSRWPNMDISLDMFEQSGVVVALAPVLM